MMDDLVPKLLLAGQKINSFTGTDYSGIEELRREIKEQEQLVRERHAAVKNAKEAFDTAHAQRAASQKEVVGLLERKHSWAATDLERYMSLIRSEHVNDQAVQQAKDETLAAEKSLEEARSRLEKRERAQYHEEQIWSDTIRRNSTWVTFVLMGFNILLLLVNVVVLEPWRRKKIVREIKSALDDKTTAIAVTLGTDESTAEPSVDELVDITGQVPEEPQKATYETKPDALLVEDGSDNPLPIDSATTSVPAEEPRPGAGHGWADRGKASVLTFQHRLAQYFSNDEVTLRRSDVTARTLEGVAAGAALMGVLFAILRSK